MSLKLIKFSVSFLSTIKLRRHFCTQPSKHNYESQLNKLQEIGEFGISSLRDEKYSDAEKNLETFHVLLNKYSNCTVLIES